MGDVVKRAAALGLAASLVAAALVVVATGPAEAGPAEPRAAGQPAPDDARLRSQADWILAAQLPDGAIARHLDRASVSPYLANYAAMGLAAATLRTHDPRYGDAAWRWLAWYGAHQDGHGFVTDYRVVGGELRSTGDLDSTDAYAGTFLMAAQRTWAATGDLARLRALAPALSLAVDAIERTQDADGLTWAKPARRVKYLMDQAEVHAGLAAAADLAGVLGDRALAARAAGDATRVGAGVAATWNPTTRAYDWAVHEDGTRVATDWHQLYPDAISQAWAVGLGLVPHDRSADLLTTLDDAQPDWARPEATATVDGRSRTVGYWAAAAFGFARLGDGDRAAGAAESIAAAADRAGRAWPFNPADAGQLLVVEAGAAVPERGAPRAVELVALVPRLLLVVAALRCGATGARAQTGAEAPADC
jgi:hypothetical protein